MRNAYGFLQRGRSMNGGVLSDSVMPSGRSGLGYDWSNSRSHKSGAIAAFSGSKGGQVCVELLLQPTFPAGDHGSTAGFQSISSERKPDIVLTRTDGDVPKWYVLDAKYRTRRSNVLQAMASAHIYRDALRWREQRPERALLLVPRGGGAPWLEQSDFVRRHRVGVCALGTDTDPEGVIQSLFGGLAGRCTAA